jgi:hypothetical protein
MSEVFVKPEKKIWSRDIITSIALCALSVVLVTFLVRGLIRTMVSTIDGFPLSGPDTKVVVYFRPGCVCDDFISKWMDTAVQNNRKCIVLTNTLSSSFSQLKKSYGTTNVRFQLSESTALKEKFSPSGKTRMSIVRNGVVISSFEGEASLSKGIEAIKS